MTFFAAPLAPLIALLIPLAPAAALPVAGWVTDWDTADMLSPLKSDLARFDTLWLFGANGEKLLNGKEGKNPWDLPSAVRDLAEAARRQGVRTGPVLHNSAEKGFDSELARKLIQDPKAIVARLKTDVEANGWRALNIDLESLPESSASQYELFLAELEKSFKGRDVVISVCLHAQDGSPDVIDIARFQNWRRLSALPLDFVVMAYDHAWSTSPPGVLAPRAWLAKVWRNARSVFGERAVLALPVYGYHWKRNGKTWSGKSDDPAPLVKKIKNSKGWIRETGVSADDGELYWLRKNSPNAEALTFDDDASVIAKLDQLSKLDIGGPERVAIWRLAGVKGPLFSDLKARKPRELGKANAK